MKRIYAYMAVMLSMALLAGVLGGNNALVQAQGLNITDQCFDPALRLGELAGLLLVPFSLMYSLMFLFMGFFLPSSAITQTKRIPEGIATTISQVIGAIPILSDLWTIALVFAFGMLDAQKIVSFNDLCDSRILDFETQIVSCIP